MRRSVCAVARMLCAAVFGVGAAVVGSAGAAVAAAALSNAGFDESGAGVVGWKQQGEAYATAEVVGAPTASAPGALHVRVGAPGSSGDKFFMLYQVIPDPSVYAGKKVRFGARVRTEGAGVDLVLYTPEGSADTFEQDTKTDGFVDRYATFTVPQAASFLSFGISVLGPSGSEAWVDDAVLELDGPQATPTPAAAATSDGPARVELDASRVQRTVSPLLFGMHIEWVENGLGLMDPQATSLRRPVLDRLVPLHIGLLRFPGGIHADYYDWKLGDGSAGDRGTSENVFSGKQERHRFGTPEYLALLRELGADALLTANYGTGTPAMAGAWAHRFAEQGVFPKYWEVGNEIYLSSPTTDGPNGKRIYHSPEQYAADFPAYRAAIQKELPAARVGAIAHIESGAYALAPADNRDWTERMLKALTTRADFVAVHNAYAPVLQGDGADLRNDEGRRKVYRGLFAAAQQSQINLDEVASQLATLSPINKGLPIAVTEFGPFFGVSTNVDANAAFVDQSRTLAAALYVASVLDVLIGDPRVFLAAYTNPIHPWYGSLVTDTASGLVQTPTYYLYELYRTRFEPRLIATDVVVAPSFSSSAVGLAKARENVPDLIVRASLSEDGTRLGAMLVNRSLDRALETEVEVKGFTPASVDCRVLSASAPNAINGPAVGSTVVAGGPEIRPVTTPCTLEGSRVQLSLPAFSVVSIVARGREG